jgi:integrase/recombinase XerD
MEAGPMSIKIVKREPQQLVRTSRPPAIIEQAGKPAMFAYAEFFEAELENDNTHRAYRHAVNRFLAWCEDQELELGRVPPGAVAGYLRGLTTRTDTPASKPTRKLHLAAIRQFFDRLVIRHAAILNPAASVKGPKHQVSEGKTPAITPEQARRVLHSSDVSHVVGLRDRAIIGVLIYTAARGGAVAKLRLGDFYSDGRQYLFRFDEKGGKVRDIPARHDLEGYVLEYIRGAGLAGEPAHAPLFRTARGKTKTLTPNGMKGKDVLRMVKRRFKAAGLPESLTCHTFRATTITDLLDTGVNPGDVQDLAGHADPRTTRLYDRRTREVTRNIVERISI